MRRVCSYYMCPRRIIWSVSPSVFVTDHNERTKKSQLNLSYPACPLISQLDQPGHNIEVCVCLLLFCVLTTSKAISGWVPTCDSVLYSAASLGHQASRPMICYPTQSHYPETEPTSPRPILIMLSSRLGKDKCQFKSLRFDSTRFWTRGLRTRTRYPWIPRSPRR